MATERRKKILIVDDESIMVSVLQHHVTNAGYDHDVAHNGQEALKRLEEDLPDLILLDLMMPGLSGFETCRRIRANERTRKLPVIIVTALHSESDSADAASCGANEFLVKPVDPELLAKLLKHYIGSPFRV
jgi:CheY-like chemotaxis protein